jgi:hypothetical protein
MNIALKPSRLKMKGTLTIHVKDCRGRILRTIIKRNTITYDAGDVVRALLAQRSSDADPDENQLGSMRFGTSTTTPTRYDTDLIEEVVAVRKELTDAKKVNGISGELTLQATLGTGEANGLAKPLAEAALCTKGTSWNDNIGGSLKMFSRQCHAPITKNSAISLDYSWTLQFTT